MRRIYILFSLVALAVSGFAQLGSNIEIFAQDGEQFTVILNGMKINQTPQTNVKMPNITGQMAKLKVIFADASLGEVDKNMFLEPGNDYKVNVTMNNKGIYKVRMVSMTPTPGLGVPPPPPAAVPTTIAVHSQAPAVGGNTTVIQETTTHTTTVGDPVGGENVSVGMNIGGISMGVNVNAGGMPMGTATSSSTVTTTTTTSSSGTVVNTAPVAAPVSPSSAVPGYNGPIGCDWPMSPGDFAQAKQSIASKSFDDSKLTIAKQIIGSNCLTCDQVRQIIQEFDFENNRLEFAKFAYGYTHDLGNFYKVNDAFDFESSIEDLNDYIQGR